MISIGIDIGSYSVKVAVMRGAGKGFDIVRLDEYPLSQDPNRDRTIELVEIFRDIQVKNSGSEVSYVIAAQHDRVALRRKIFPFRERHKILKSLPFELEEDIPFQPETSVFDFKTTHFVGNNASVIAVATTKEYLKTLLRQVGDAQLYPEIVSVEGLALANAYEQWREAPVEYSDREADLPESEPVDVVVHIGHQSTLVLVLRDGYVLDLRQIDWGGKDLADTIATKYSMHYLEALKELRKKAFILTNNDGATREQVALSEVIKGGVDVLAHEIQLVMLELRTTYNLSYRMGQLSGGVSLIRNLGPYLTQKLEIPFNRVGSLSIAPQIDFAASPNNEISFLVAIGLSLEALKRPKNPPINLLKGEFARQSEAIRMIWEKYRTFAMTVGAAFFILFVWGYLREGYATDMAIQAGDNLRSLGRKILAQPRVREAQIKTYIKEQEQKAKMKKLFEQLQTISSPLDIVNKLTRTAPNRSEGLLIIKRVSITNEVVRVAGEAAQADLVTRIQSALKAMSKDGKVNSRTGGAPTKPGNKTFSYEIRVNRKTVR